MNKAYRGPITFFRLLAKTVRAFMRDDPMVYSSSIAFYTMFSLPAILMIVISIAGSAFETQAVHENLLNQVQRLFGGESASMVDKLLNSDLGVGSTLFAKGVGIATLLFSATSVFVSLQNALNSIWGVKPQVKEGVLAFVLTRLLSLAMVISIGFLLLVSLVIDTLLSVFNQMLSSWFSEGTYYVIFTINILISLSVITSVFAVIFRVLPDAKVHWKDVWMGALVTTVLFTTGKYLIGFYLGNSDIASAYGAAGSLVLLLAWVFYSCTILLFGAEFTFIYSQERGHLITPSDHAVMVKKVIKEHGVVNAPNVKKGPP